MEKENHVDSTEKFDSEDKAPPANRLFRNPGGGSNTSRTCRNIFGWESSSEEEVGLPQPRAQAGILARARGIRKRKSRAKKVGRMVSLKPQFFKGLKATTPNATTHTGSAAFVQADWVTCAIAYIQRPSRHFWIVSQQRCRSGWQSDGSRFNVCPGARKTRRHKVATRKPRKEQNERKCKEMKTGHNVRKWRPKRPQCKEMKAHKPKWKDTSKRPKCKDMKVQKAKMKKKKA